MTTGRINQVALRRYASSCASTLAFPHLTQKVPEYRSSFVATSNTFLTSGATRTPVDDGMPSTDVDCFHVSTVTDSPSKVPAIAAAPIWYDARLRSHSNGMTAAGLAGNDWGLLNSPHALAVRFHQYTLFLLSSHVDRGRSAACGHRGMG